MKTISLVFSLSLVCGLGCLRAQNVSPTPKPVPPSGPLIQKRAPDMSRWIITLKAQTPAAKGTPAGTPAPQPTVVVTKTGQIVHVQRVDEQRRVWETWVRGTTQVAIIPGVDKALLVSAPPHKDLANPLYFDFSRSDFQGFDWISADNYTGIKPIMGKNCMVFKDEQQIQGSLTSAPAASSADPAASPAAAAPVTTSAIIACVDVDSRLPVALMNDDGSVTYDFSHPPEAMQELPPKAIAALDKQKNDAKAVQRKGTTPY